MRGRSVWVDTSVEVSSGFVGFYNRTEYNCSSPPPFPLPCSLLINALFPDTLDPRALNLPPMGSKPTSRARGWVLVQRATPPSSSEAAPPSTVDEVAAMSDRATPPSTIGESAVTDDASASSPSLLSLGALEENLRLLLASAHSIGCSLEGITLEGLLEGQVCGGEGRAAVCASLCRAKLGWGQTGPVYGMCPRCRYLNWYCIDELLHPPPTRDLRHKLWSWASSRRG